MSNEQAEEQAHSKHCECGTATGFACTAELSDDSIVVEYMPRWLRASYKRTGNSSRYPHNGAIWIRCDPYCAELLSADQPEWVKYVGVAS